jgi:hypothetical protein
MDSSLLSPAEKRSEISKKGWATKQTLLQVREEEKEKAREQRRQEIGAKLDHQAEVIMLTNEVNPATAKPWSHRDIAKTLGLSKTTIARMLGANYTGKSGRPTDMSEGAKALLFAEVQEHIGDKNKPPLTAKILSETYKHTLVVDRRARGLDPKAMTDNTGKKRLLREFKMRTGSVLKRPSPQTERRARASTFQNLYAYFMNLKATFISLSKHQPSECPRGFILARHLVLFDEMNMSASGRAEGAQRHLSQANFGPSMISDVGPRHLTGGWYFSADGMLLANTFVLSGSSNIVDAAPVPPQPLRLSNVIVNEHGSMETDKDGQGAMTAPLGHLRSQGLDRTKPPKGMTEQPYVLLMDNHSTHVNEGVLLFARERNILVATPPSNSTHLLQPHDNERINGQVKLRLSALHTFCPAAASQPHLHLHAHEQVIMEVNVLKNIVTAVKNCGFEYSDDMQFVGITDAGACTFCESLLREGRITSRDNSPVDVKRLRHDNILATRALVRQGMLPPDLAFLPSESVISATHDALRRFGKSPAWKKAKTRKRAWAVDAHTRAGANAGSLILNDDAQIKTYYENIAAEKLAVEAAEKKRAGKAEKVAAKQTQEEMRAERAASLHAVFPQVAPETWIGWNRNLGRYYNGKWPLEQAVDRVRKLLGVSEIATAPFSERKKGLDAARENIVWSMGTVE